MLGLGDIGPEAGMPVMEGKCVLFKAFGGRGRLSAVHQHARMWTSSCSTVYLISGSFGGINLEDIAAPRCFEIERKLKEMCDIPVFHDDQHGTAIITLAGLTNALQAWSASSLEDVQDRLSTAPARPPSPSAKLLLSRGRRET